MVTRDSELCDFKIKLVKIKSNLKRSGSVALAQPREAARRRVGQCVQNSVVAGGRAGPFAASSAGAADTGRSVPDVRE